MSPYFIRLNRKIIEDYCGRKKQGQLCLIYNTKNKKFIALPKKIEHSEFIARLLNVSKENIKNKEVDASYFIPVSIVIIGNQITGIIIGISSLEMGCGVRHRKEDLFNARNASIVLISNAQISVKEDYKLLVSTKYLTNT